MDRASMRRLGAALGAFGFLLLAFNFVDFLAGFNALADELAIIGAISTLGGSYLALKG